MFKIVSTQDELIKSYLVRAIVFMDEQKCPYNLEIDSEEYSALHVVGVNEDGEPYAAGRIRFFGNYAKLERIAIRKQWRGGGRGVSLVEFMIEIARNKGFTMFKMHAQAYLESFYGKLGFKAEGDHFDEAGIDHVVMVKRD